MVAKPVVVATTREDVMAEVMGEPSMVVTKVLVKGSVVLATSAEVKKDISSTAVLEAVTREVTVLPSDVTTAVETVSITVLRVEVAKALVGDGSLVGEGDEVGC